MDEEDQYITFLCSLPDSRDTLVMAIRSTIKILVCDEVVTALLSKDMRWKSSESTNEALGIG